MGVGIFTEKKHRPTDEEFYAVLGARQNAWHELVREIRERYAPQEEIKFLYGKKYGWAQRFLINGQLLTNLYPTQGGFTAQLNLSVPAVEEALTFELTPGVRQAIEGAHPYPEGRWIFIPCTCDDDLQYIKKLLALRVETRRLLK